eukprot:TRINITY_DN66796_c9_g1_i1.p1 TRINITY_DN66796_c9_g1~~TRINITY_DN66796_c9_g1_i1.p1  ORF type:complete len:356 (+),score=216.14 TRINITY_DN66796_c9_g1_i1:98-1069(+)
MSAKKKEDFVTPAMTEEEAAAFTSNNSCRMYEAQFPEVDDLVMVQVKNVAEMGAYVELLEYNNIEGMILLSELSRRRIRSINKLIRVGRTEVVVVLRVDRDKGYIDLSKRRVSPEEIAACEEKYQKSKAVHSIMRHVSERLKVPLVEMYEKFGWDLYKRFGHAYNAFKLAITQREQVLGQYDLSDDMMTMLMTSIERRLTPQAIKVRADLELTCFAYEGIDAIKAALRAAEEFSTKEMPIKIKLVAPPLYVMMCTTLDKKLGVETLEKACAKIGEVLKSKGGELNIKNPPRAVTDRDDRLLSMLMETLEKQNQQVSGDDDHDD